MTLPANSPSRPPADIAQLNQFLTMVGSETEDWIFNKPGQSLYHYTDLAGLCGIVGGGDLWLSDSRYCNDEEEMTHGYTTARRVVAEVRGATADPGQLYYLDALDALLAQPRATGVYICCFCQKDNLLSQWRGYGSNGVGVSIQMNPSEFAYVTGPDSPPGGMMRLWSEFYRVDTQERILRNAVQFGYDNLGHLIVQERVWRAADAIEFFIPTFKNEGFHEEQESRLIFTPSAQCTARLSYRAARGMLIPYYSLRELSGGFVNSQGRLPITGVTVGPSAQRQLNVESVRRLLHQQGYVGVEPRASTMPYRG